MERDGDYAAPGKPACDWDDPVARAAVVDALVRDGYRALHSLRGQVLDERAGQAAELLATVVGQDIEETDDGSFRLAHGVAADRVISVVDPEARHGHKTAAHRFDGYKGHLAIDPDSEIITATAASAAATPDAEVAKALLADLPEDDDTTHDDTTHDAEPAQPEVYGDSSYGTATHLVALDQRGVRAMVSTQVPTAPGGRMGKDRFGIDLAAGTVTCPARLTVPIIPARSGGGRARFGKACGICPLRPGCTASARGRVISIHPLEAHLAAARARQQDPAWRADYRATRPKVERKLAHLLRRRHGGRHARVRGLARIDQDWRLLAAAANLARLATLGLGNAGGRWQVSPA